MAIAALEAAPEEISQALKRQAEVTNLPRVGYDGNYAYPTMQANFAACQPRNALARELPATISHTCFDVCQSPA